MGTLFWKMWVGLQCSPEGLYERRAEGDSTHRQGEDPVTTEARAGVMWP